MNTFATYTSHQLTFMPLAKRCYQTDKGVTIELFYAVAPSWHALPPFYPLFASDFVCKFGTRARSSAIRNCPQFAKAAQYQLFAKHLIRSARSAKLNCNYFSALQLCLFWVFLSTSGRQTASGLPFGLEKRCFLFSSVRRVRGQTNRD